jgi:hypothetical protein
MATRILPCIFSMLSLGRAVVNHKNMESVVVQDRFDNGLNITNASVTR